MNQVQLIGNLTKDIDLRKTQTGKSVVNFTVAVTRAFDREKTDFIQCQAWDKAADILYQYCQKGSKVGITGQINTGHYEKNGQTVQTTTVVVSQIDLLSSRERTTGQNQQTGTNTYKRKESPSTIPYSESLTEEAEKDFGIQPEDLPF